MKICKKGKYAGWANKFGLNPIRLAIGLSDREEPVDELFNSAGSSVVRTIAFGVVGDDCIWEFSISGTHKGNTISATIGVLFTACCVRRNFTRGLLLVMQVGLVKSSKGSALPVGNT